LCTVFATFAPFLTLPQKLGGYRFALPELNQRIALPKSIRKYFSKAYYACDLYWPDQKIAVEYDSDQFHTGSDRIANDSNKRNALASIGIQVVSVTRQQLYNSKELESVAQTVAKQMSRRLQLNRDSFLSTHRALRRELL